jgi:V8-like Glu-specific endopeptidase
MARELEYELTGELEQELEGESEAVTEMEAAGAGREWELEAGAAQSEWELVTAGPEYTVILPRDDRVLTRNTTAIPFRYICKLEMVFLDPKTRTPRNFIGTGTLVAPGKVLTAAHCIFDREHNFGYARSIRVIPGKNGPGRTRGEEPFGFALSRRFDVPAAWRTATDNRAAMPFDYGVITLDRPIGRRVGWWRRIGHKPDAFLQRYRVNTAGYPGDKGGNHLYRVYDRVVRVYPQRFEFVLDVMGGQSGSPIWVRWQQYRKIVGIVTTHDDPLTAVVANTGVRITPTILANIRRWLTR